MLGESQVRQIVALAKDGAPVEEISRALDIAPELVKLALTSNGSDRDISDEELSMLRKHAFNLAMSAENETVQAKMTRYLIDRDKPKAPQAVSPIVQINQAIGTMQQSFAELVKTYDAPPA